jgi:hypothetical protein
MDGLIGPHTVSIDGHFAFKVEGVDSTPFSLSGDDTSQSLLSIRYYR